MTPISTSSVGARRILARTNLLILSSLLCHGLVVCWRPLWFGLLDLLHTLEVALWIVGPWRAIILRRAAGFVAVGGYRVSLLPLPCSRPTRRSWWAHTPVGVAMVGGAFMRRNAACAQVQVRNIGEWVAQCCRFAGVAIFCDQRLRAPIS